MKTNEERSIQAFKKDSNKKGALNLNMVLDPGWKREPRTATQVKENFINISHEGQCLATETMSNVSSDSADMGLVYYLAHGLGD